MRMEATRFPALHIQANSPRVRGFAWLLVVTIVLFGLPTITRATEKQADSFSRTDYLPKVMLIDQAGQSVSFAALKGKPALVGFIHTSCQGVCEMLTAKMKSVAQELGPSFGNEVTIVSVTTDPKEDGPAQLAAYAKAQGTIGPGWIFLTGQRDQVDRILKVYNVPEGDPGDELTHVIEFYLIGADGHQLHHYNGTDVSAKMVAADIRSALVRRDK